MRVLVVDWSSAVRTRIAARLVEAGLEIAGEAQSADDALAAASSTAPEAIVLDVMLPDHRGADLLPALRALVPDAVVIVLTNAMYLRGPCLARGADHVLDKSADFDKLADVLAT